MVINRIYPLIIIARYCTTVNSFRYIYSTAVNVLHVLLSGR